MMKKHEYLPTTEEAIAFLKGFEFGKANPNATTDGELSSWCGQQGITFEIPDVEVVSTADSTTEAVDEAVPDVRDTVNS